MEPVCAISAHTEVNDSFWETCKKYLQVQMKERQYAKNAYCNPKDKDKMTKLVMMLIGKKQ